MMVLLRRLLREPLLHFLCLGGLFFVLWWAMHPRSPRGDMQIVVSAADVQRLRVLATRQWGHDPSAVELAELVKSHVREEVLVREALAGGLDLDDVIIRRRLVQKMESLVPEDVPAPSDAQLQIFWAEHAVDYASDPPIRFQQIFFSNDLRKQHAVSDAQTALLSLQKGVTTVTGDPLMLPNAATPQTRAALARDYGQTFAQQLFALPTDAWDGPLQSPLGVHLVRVAHHSGTPHPDFEAVRDRVRRDWLRHQQLAAQDAAYQQLRQRYQIQVDVSGRAANGVQP